MKGIISMEEAIKNYVQTGSRIMVGGFLGCNTPLKAIDELVKQDKNDLTIISTVNSFTSSDFGLLFDKKQVSKFIGSHLGTNSTAVKQYKSGDIDVEYYPQGTLVEKIRCSAAGLGGVLTPTGIGTLMEEGKEKLTVEGKEYILETPLKADVAIIKGFKADKKGNILYKGTMNANPIMAGAATITIAEVEEIVEVGELAPHQIQTPGVLVDYVCVGYTDEDYHKRTQDMCKSIGIY